MVEAALTALSEEAARIEAARTTGFRATTERTGQRSGEEA